MRSGRALAIGMLALLCLGFGAADHAARSQAGRVIKMIISVPPGGAIDFLVRVLADQISKTHGPTFIVESRPGAGSVIAAEAAGARYA